MIFFICLKCIASRVARQLHLQSEPTHNVLFPRAEKSHFGSIRVNHLTSGGENKTMSLRIIVLCSCTCNTVLQHRNCIQFAVLNLFLWWSGLLVISVQPGVRRGEMHLFMLDIFQGIIQVYFEGAILQEKTLMWVISVWNRQRNNFLLQKGDRSFLSLARGLIRRML